MGTNLLNSLQYSFLCLVSRIFAKHLPLIPDFLARVPCGLLDVIKYHVYFWYPWSNDVIALRNSLLHMKRSALNVGRCVRDEVPGNGKYVDKEQPEDRGGDTDFE